MSLDIRIPIGSMFVIVGAILLVFGLVTFNSDIYKVSLTYNINLWSGVASLIFGLIMLALAWRATQREKQKPK
jgi:membrane protein implicated in regulation of membrane protease activity